MKREENMLQNDTLNRDMSELQHH